MLGDLMKIPVNMKRGGTILLDVEGKAYNDKDGSGHSWEEVEIYAIYWSGGSKVADKNIADMKQVEQAFLDALRNRDKDPD